MDFGSIGIFNLVSNLIVSVYIIGSVFYILKNKTNNKQ
ncbi:hypothetical protein CG08_0878 [Riemerella anatipestifer]|nr:hypothetical protein G148_0831 [Riemerella anatipestifer RA-CH-2]AKP69184.1 hypothetical protein CG08_0878 [Riemerella anatipestifer]